MLSVWDDRLAKINMFKKHKTLIIAVIIVFFIFFFEAVGSFIKSKEVLANVIFAFVDNIRLIVMEQ